MKQLLILACLIGMAGCANTQFIEREAEAHAKCGTRKFPTKEGLDECFKAATETVKDEMEYERINARIEEEEAIRNLERLCEVSNETVFLYQGPDTPKCRMLNRRAKTTELCIPRGALVSDYTCVYRRELERELRRLGL